MKTILSIDFDIIMAPSIELYNNQSGVPWEKRFHDAPMLQFLSIDAQTYSKIIQILLNLFPFLEKDDIHFLQEHHSIIKHLDKAETYKVINLDHHHDWCYEEKQKIERIPEDQLNCGNWVKYLSDSNQLVSYTWVNNITSQSFDNTATFEIVKIQDFLLNGFQLKEIDEVYLILSPEFVPPYYQPLFFTWLDIANQFYNCHYEMEDLQEL